MHTQGQKQKAVMSDNGKQEIRSKKKKKAALYLFLPLLCLSGLELLLYFLDQSEGSVEVGGGCRNLTWLLCVGTAVCAENTTHKSHHLLRI